MSTRAICLILAVLIMVTMGGFMGNTEVKAADAQPDIQARGVWHRPNVTGTETDLSGICAVLDTFRETGINLVFLETFYHGMTIYRSNFAGYYTGFADFDYSPYPDYLSAFVAEAEKRNIEVHAWVEDFYIGVKESNFTRFFPQWLMLTKDGNIRHSEGVEYGGYIFLDPANPELRQYLVRFYDELLTKFPQIAGLNLDYIRYPVSSRKDDTGYTDVAMEAFAAEVGISFPENATRQDKVAAVAAQELQWIQFRADQVTAFVGEVYGMVKTRHPQVLLSTAVFPEQGKSFADKKQDFNTWLQRGYLDIITPMAYYDDIPTLKRQLKAMLPELSACYCYAGISPTYHNLSDQQVLDQMQTVQEVGADGYVFFGSQSILNNSQYIQLLRQNVSSDALLPHGKADQLVEYTRENLMHELTAAGESAENIRNLLAQLDIQAEDADPAGMSQLRKQLRLLYKYNLQAYITEENLGVAQPILGQLFRCIEVKTTRLLTKFPQLPEAPEQPDTPAQSVPPASTSAEQVPDSEPKDPLSGRNKMLGFGALFAALAAAGIACIHAVRKGRKKE